MTLAVLFCGAVVWLNNNYGYYSQVRTVNAALAKHPEIDKVWLSTNDDVRLEVEQLYFSVAGEPRVTYRIDGIDGASKSEIGEKLERALLEKQSVVLPGWVTEHRN